jgi:hypothetical protein
LYNALNFFLISMTTGDADKVSSRHGTCQLLLTILVIDWRNWDGFRYGSTKEIRWYLRVRDKPAS